MAFSAPSITSRPAGITSSNSSFAIGRTTLLYIHSRIPRISLNTGRMASTAFAIELNSGSRFRFLTHSIVASRMRSNQFHRSLAIPLSADIIRTPLSLAVHASFIFLVVSSHNVLILPSVFFNLSPRSTCCNRSLNPKPPAPPPPPLSVSFFCMTSISSKDARLRFLSSASFLAAPACFSADAAAALARISTPVNALIIAAMKLTALANPRINPSAIG